MALAHRPGTLDKRRLVKLRRLPQHRPCDLDGTVEGQFTDHATRRIRQLRQAAAEGHPHVQLDVSRQPAHDVIKKIHLIFREPSGAQRKEIGHAPQSIRSPRHAFSRDRTFELIDQVLLRFHLFPFALRKRNGTKFKPLYATFRSSGSP